MFWTNTSKRDITVSCVIKMCPAVDMVWISSYPGKQFYTRIYESFDITCKLKKTVLYNSLTYLYIF